jgi:hypothetical protein
MLTGYADLEWTVSQKLSLIESRIETRQAHKVLAKSEGCGLLADGQACCI